MKTIFKILILGLFLTAFSVAAFGQCDETAKQDYEKFLETRKGSLAERKTAVEAGKKYVEKCKDNAEAKEILDYLNGQLPKMQAQIEKEERANRFNESFQSKNWSETYASGREILAKDDPDYLDVILILGSIGLLESAKTPPVQTFNADTIHYAKMAIQKIEAGKSSEQFGAFQFTYKNSENALGWMHFIIGTLMTNGQKATKESIAYLYKATKYNSDTKTNPSIYRSIGAWYLDDTLRFITEREQKLTANNNEATEETEALLVKIKAYAERAIDAYSRTYNIVKTDSKVPKAYKDDVYQKISQLYEIRFDKQEGIDEYIAAVVTKPMPDPTTDVVPGNNETGNAPGNSAQKETPPAGGTPKPFVFPKQETFTLQNGMKVTLVQYGSVPKVAMQAVIRAGSLNEAEEQRWISDAVANLIKEGTAKRSAEQIARETAEMGGSIFVSPSNDKTTIGGEVLSEFDVRFLTLLADIIMNPRFEAADLEQYRANKLREIVVAKTQAQNQAWEKFRQIIFTNHPYNAVFPNEEIVKNYKVEDVKKFYNENYGAARTHLYVVGQFNAAAVKNIADKAFSSWGKGAESIKNIPKVEGKRSLTAIDRPDSPQSTIYLGMPAPSPSDADFVKFTVMNSILGGSFGSRITSNIREDKGYTYSPFSSVWTRYKTGYWYESADVTTEFTGASIKEILYEIDRMQKEPVSNAELQGIKNYMIGIYVLQNSTRNGVISQIENMNFNELDKNYLDTYIQKLTAVTAKDVQEMAQKYLNEDKMTIVVVGDLSKINEQLKPYEK